MASYRRASFSGTGNSRPHPPPPLTSHLVRPASAVAALAPKLPPLPPPPKEAAQSAAATSSLLSPSSPSSSSSSSSPLSQSSAVVEKVIPRALTLLALLLERIIARNEQGFPVLGPVGAAASRKPRKPSPSSSSSSSSRKQLQKKEKASSFHGLRAPAIPVSKYLERIHKYTKCSPSCFVVAFIYMDRLVYLRPHQPITSLNVHRLLVTSTLVASKVFEDVHFNNSFYAKVGGISNVELNKLELELLFVLDFQVQVTFSEFESYCSYLEKELHISEEFIPMQKALPVFGGLETFEKSDSTLKEDVER